MKCQSCGKKEATVKYFEDINGVKQELHFCLDCAKKMGFETFTDIFTPIFNVVPKFFVEETKEEICPKCGYTFNDYLKTGYFGCTSCYDAFSENLDSLFLKLQGNTRHVESKTLNKNEEKKLSKEEKISILKGKLADFVKKEEYEEAAKLRDKIRKMEEE